MPKETQYNNVVRIGVSTKGCTMYLSCGARGIISRQVLLESFVKDKMLPKVNIG